MKKDNNIEFFDSDDDDGAFEELGKDEVDALDDDNEMSPKRHKVASPPESPTAKKKKKKSPDSPKKRKSSKKLASTKSLKDGDSQHDGKPKSVNERVPKNCQHLMLMENTRSHQRRHLKLKKTSRQRH